MKVTLKELCWLLRDERRGLTELQQQFAKAKATWETERAELKGHASQVSLFVCGGHSLFPSPDLDGQVSEVGAKETQDPLPFIMCPREIDRNIGCTLDSQNASMPARVRDIRRGS